MSRPTPVEAAARRSADGFWRAAGAPRRTAAWPLRPALAGLMGLLLSASLQAGTPGVDEPPLPAPPRALQLPQFEEQRLPNGVRVVLAPRPGVPLVSLALHLGLGSAADPEGQAGLASLTASLRTKGAKRQGKDVDANQLARQAEALGGTLDAGASWLGSSLSMTVASPRLPQALSLLVDVTLQPTLKAEELERLREQTADGLKFAQSDPMALAGLVARRVAWGSSVYGGALTPDSLARIRLTDVQAMHRRQLRPEIATLVISGDFDRDAALVQAARLLGSWRGNRMALPEPRRELPSPATPATVLVNLPGAGQSAVIVMAPSVPADSPERRVAQVAGAVLGGGYSARLNTEVRIKRGLSYGASAGNELQAVGGVLSASTQTSHPNAAQVVSLIQAELDRLGQAAPSTEELAARQATLVGSFGRQIETTAGLAGLALDQIARGRPLTEIAAYAPAVLAVTPEQVQRFAAKHWAKGQWRTVVVGDLAAAGDSLKAMDPQALVLEAPALDLSSARLKP